MGFLAMMKVMLSNVFRIKPRINLILCCIAVPMGIFGCSTGNGGSPLYQQAGTKTGASEDLSEYQTLLVQNGKYTDAAMLGGLSDESQWETISHEPSIEREVSQPQEVQVQPAIDEEPLPQPLTAQFSSLQNDHTQKTSLGGKWHARLGWSLMVNGNHDGAVAAYREALRQNDSLAEAYLGVGILLKKEGKVEDAVAAYKKALTLNPKYAAALVHLGYAYADDQNNPTNIEKAKRLFSRASKQGDPFAMIALIDLKTRR